MSHNANSQNFSIKLRLSSFFIAVVGSTFLFHCIFPRDYQIWHHSRNQNFSCYTQHWHAFQGSLSFLLLVSPLHPVGPNLFFQETWMVLLSFASSIVTSWTRTERQSISLRISQVYKTISFKEITAGKFCVFYYNIWMLLVVSLSVVNFEDTILNIEF